MPLLPLSEGDPILETEFGGYSTAGTKARNEDAFAARQPEGGERIYKGIVACIADGVSCSENAQQASTTSVTDFIQNYYSTPDTWAVKHAAARVLSSLNSWLFYHGQQSSTRHNGLVTTFTGVICKSTTAHIFHAGDSRIYRWRKGQLEQLSRDHTHHQGAGRSFLTRALGMDNHLEVDYFQADLQAGDVLLLSTDGLHGFLRDREISDLLKIDYISLEACARHLVNEALEAGSDDNVSCLLVRIKQLPLDTIDEVHRKLTQQVIPPVLQVGHKLDDYEVLRVLHSGTRSHVYVVKHPQQQSKRVLKAPSPNFAEDVQYLEGFIREQWVGQRINSPSVMKIFARPPETPFLYHLCEYIEGTTLRQWLIDHPRPSLEKIREITAGIIAAVRVFQRMGMVHRDIKPENLIIDERGRVRLIDFGTVQVDSLDEIYTPLQEEVPVGSVDYIAPEYLHGEKGTHAADIFSLGVIIYEMCTGHLPFKTDAIKQHQPQRYMDWQYISARHWRPELPLWLDLTLQKACNPNPANRYQVMSELQADLSKPNAALVDVHQRAPLLQRNPVLFWKVASGLLLAVVIAQWVVLAN